jgi:hypothetical protein
MIASKFLPLLNDNNHEGLVYFIGDECTGPVKIGFTSRSDPQQRLKELQTGSHYNLKLLGYRDGTMDTEQKIHSFLSLHKIRGEWFDRTPALCMLKHLTYGKTKATNLFVKQLVHLAFAIEDPMDDTESREGDDALSTTVGRHLILDIVERFRCCRIDEPLPLLAWLLTQVDQEGPTADLANDCKGDALFPPTGSLTDYLTYMGEVSNSPNITRTVIDAWIECQQVILKMVH